MVTKTQIKYGSKGDEVKELQTALNNKGYNLSVDGVFGSKTQAAVKDYQSKNSLQVDGIVGKNTWGSLLPTTSESTGTTTNTATGTSGATSGTAQATPSEPQKSAMQIAIESVPQYQESDLVAQAKASLQAQLANKPSAYQSPYQQQINDTLNAILNREKFEYDMNADALYQQYKDQYTREGQKAMLDTMGQAATLTGGYGNSYAQTVGQQTYQNYLNQLNDRVPELYQLALDQYNREGDELLNQYSLYADRENTDYGRYRDALNDYYTNLDYLTGQYENERGFDYGKYADNLNLGYQIYQDQLNDERWQAEFDEAVRQWNIANGFNADGTPISVSSSSSPKKKKKSDEENTVVHDQQNIISATVKTINDNPNMSSADKMALISAASEEAKKYANTEGDTYWEAWKKYIGAY